MAQNAPPARNDVIHNVLSEESGQSLFACAHCRRQKVKCDRSLPSCANCNKSSRPCSYPLTVQKPGPKAGTTRRPKALQLHTDANPSTEPEAPGTKRARLQNDGRESASTPTSDHAFPRSELGGPNAHMKPSPSATSHSSRTSAKSDARLLKLVHPTHEPSSSGTRVARVESWPGSDAAYRNRFKDACLQLGCSEQQGHELLRCYFQYMTTLSLFHRPSFEAKLRAITHEKQLIAFLSALFSYTLRFKDELLLVRNSNLSAMAMLDLCCRLHQECVEECLDDDPPLHLLQSFYIATWQRLIQGVRGTSWRMLGDCIRIAYTLQLHMLDSAQNRQDFDDSQSSTDLTWIAREERRRIWWALWEADIFTSIIRKLPNAIDDRLNMTLLPATDEDWFNGNEASSCFLASDANKRWRTIVNLRTKSPQTWFILVNSYMYDAHKMSFFPEIWADRIGFRPNTSQNRDSDDELLPQMREFIDECLQSAATALPPELSWDDNKFLAFVNPSASGVSPRKEDNDVYCIHVMLSLAKLTLSVLAVQRNIQQAALNTKSHGSPERKSNHTETWSTRDSVLWHRYLIAADSMADMIRNSSPQQYRYANPLIVSAIWYSAASLVVAKLFGPPGFDSRRAQANFEVLITTLDKFELFWGTPKVLELKMRNLEASLHGLRQRASASRSRTGSPVNSSEPQPMFGGTVPMSDQMARQGGQQFAFNQAIPHDNFSQSSVNHTGTDWATQNIFDFNAIPTFGGGPGQYYQQPPFTMDTNFDTNLLLNGDGLNFNELFAYPFSVAMQQHPGDAGP